MSKKHLIMEKALELFAENGIESTSVQQITERCGISKGAFYLNFKSKDELIFSLIDHFMSTIIAEIDHSVRNEIDTNKLLYNFIFASFHELQKRASLAKLFLKEEVFTFNKELFERLQMYTNTINNLLFSIIQKQFSSIKRDKHIDILFTINGLMKSYSELFLLDHYPINLEQLSNGIVEKITIIAEKSTIISIITPEYLTKSNVYVKIGKEQILQLLQEASEEVKENPIIQESLTLLINNLNQPQFSEAIIQGLLNNLRTDPNCKWVAFMYQQYINENVSK